MVDRDLAPEDAGREIHTITHEEYSETLDNLYEGKIEPDQDPLYFSEITGKYEPSPPKIGQAEGQAILRCMRHPTDRLTKGYLDSMGRYHEMTDKEQRLWKKVEQTLGLPNDDEDVFVERMDPKKMLWYLNAERGHIEHEGKKLRVLNDEFKLFTVEPYDLETYPDGLEERNMAVLNCSTHPALIRLNAVFPGLSKVLRDYGTDNGTRRMELTEFYSGLMDESSDDARQLSRHRMILFALADSLLQRLVRPDDRAYQGLLMMKAAKAMQADIPMQELIPVYDDIEEAERTKGHTVAHRLLW